MSEENNTTSWEESPIAQVYNPDGSPKEGAETALKELGHEEISGFALRNNQGFFDALKSGKDARAGLSQKLEGHIKLPTEESKPEEIEAYRKAVGAFGSPDEYAQQMWPDDLPEDFPKDEKLQGFASEWATKHHVPASAVKELTAGFIEYQNSTVADYEAKNIEEANQKAEETRKTLTNEFGGTQAFEEFSKGAKEFLTSQEAQQAGFEFKTVAEGEDAGKLYTENPLHQAMLNDPSFLRMVKKMAATHNPARLPGSAPAGMTPEQANARRAELTQKQINGTLDSAGLDELNQLRGFSR